MRKSDAHAVMWTRAGAMMGEKYAQCDYGLRLVEGEGVAQDKAEAARQYAKAARQGLEGAQCILGLMFVKGEGVERSYEQARVLFRRSARQGWAQAQLCLGILFANGDGVRQSLPRALRNFRRAAAQGLPESAEQVQRLEGVPAATRRCALPSCAKPESLRRRRRLECCAGCKGTPVESYYCSAECQAADAGRHGPLCPGQA